MSASSVTLETGKAYPYGVVPDGATVDFLANDINVMLVGLPFINEVDSNGIIYGEAKCGLIHKGGALLLLFSFKTKDDVISFDVPFDASLIPKEQLKLDDVTTPTRRVLFQIHLVDSATNNFVGIRYLTFSPELTLEFFDVVQDQLANPHRQQSALAQIDSWQRKYEPQDMEHLATSMHLLGQQ
ncbi:TPA: hypothetical protein I7730_00135 [Vibrio vulnificus]|uniref:Uncharacterized protein n=1 Tax=Vibrio vulnificus TaxID=672 RepID=A0A8H9K5E0_VIBVL|nr:hypothetical protein [Vibrio vulnificus]HAS8538206.1 hypothetical protein [Vibrio vulnificus]